MRNKITNHNYSFVVDAMLGKIARKLRMFGFDTIYKSDLDDGDILNPLTYKKRVILTNDKELYNRCTKKGIDIILINKNTEIENLIMIFRSLNIKFINPLLSYSRCTICNSLLTTISNNNLINQNIPEKILNNNKIFYKCGKCDKIYWQGTHTKNITILIGKINEELSN